uniref:ribonuclease 3-like protein 3 n=1 Tax=Erigeron canadensis TaxID=72917 RepID=UPI001CB91833|nr:ribonuclease 3-like protein 3 [Erigeron canadensis]
MSELVNEPGSPLFLASLMDVETIIGYNFKNKDLLREALTHHSYKDDVCQSYERLEYLGDSVLNFMITKEHYFLYPKMKSGDLTLLRAANVDTEALARVAFKHGLHKFLRHHDPLLDRRVQELSEGVEEYPLHSHGLIHSPKILADIVESIIGAVYVDTSLSMDETWKVAKKLLQPLTTLENLNLNPVTKLNQACQKMGIKLEYKNLWVEKGDIEIYIGNELIGKGNYKQKKTTARNKAAADAYENLAKQWGLKDDHMDFGQLLT